MGVDGPTSQRHAIDKVKKKTIELRKIMNFMKRVKVKAGGNIGKSQKENRMGITKQLVQKKKNLKVNQWSCERNQRMWRQQPIQSIPSLDCRNLSRE
jgi:ribosomal protein S9